MVRLATEDKAICYVVYNWVCGKLVENNSPNATRRKQLVESRGRKSGRKLTRRTEIECKLVE